MSMLKFDKIGYWSEVKLEIIRDYASVYSKIMSAPQQRSIGLKHAYVDAFAGAGLHFSKGTEELILGSPLNALNVRPPFDSFYLVDLDSTRTDHLRQLVGGRTDVHVFTGDCNKVVLSEIFPRLLYKDYWRALCVLDPYGLDLDWKVMKTAGQMKSIEIFLNFPIMDINRNVCWKNPEGVAPDDVRRMDAFWGDGSWKDVAYTKEPGLFGDIEEKTDNMTIANAFRDRLKKVAGFAYVPEPMPMRNSRGAIVYYLFYAAPNQTGAKIVQSIFAKHMERKDDS